MSTYSLAVIQPYSVIIGPAKYQDTAAHIITDLLPCFKVGTRHSELKASLGILQIYTRPDYGNNVKDDSSDHIMYFQSLDIQVL